MTVLPRLAVIGEVNPHRMTGGNLVLYRLLQSYPPGRLLVVNNFDQGEQDPATRLPGVEYRSVRYHIPRIIKNRFNPFWPVGSALYIGRGLRNVREAVDDFRPEAILAVSQWFLWLAGANLARQLQIPLHLIHHDEWTTSMSGPGRFGLVRRMMRWVMRRAYRQARSHLCVSPGMAEQYERWFGVPGQVLYPSWGEDSPVPIVRVRQAWAGPPVVAYCGQVHASQGGVIDLLRRMAGILAGLGGQLDMYTRTPIEQLATFGLDQPAVRVAGFFPAAEMSERVSRTAHALLLPASFRSQERVDTATLFPSKLADYTAIGLPILVWGPAYSSAARWAADNPDGIFQFVGEDSGPIQDIICRLIADREYATRLAAGAIEAGYRYFNLNAAQSTIYSALIPISGMKDHSI